MNAVLTLMDAAMVVGTHRVPLCAPAQMGTNCKITSVLVKVLNRD